MVVLGAYSKNVDSRSCKKIMCTLKRARKMPSYTLVTQASVSLISDHYKFVM